jgi:hypothetical protein
VGSHENFYTELKHYLRHEKRKGKIQWVM